MLTPRSGRETRELLGARLRRGERAARRRLERGVEAFERLRDEVSEAASNRPPDPAEPVSIARPV
jgi:hypothetical protein